MAALDRLCLRVGERAPDLARRSACEQAPAHPDPAVDPPAVDRELNLGERSLPREHVRVHGVDERAVEIEDERPLRAVHAEDGAVAACGVATCSISQTVAFSRCARIAASAVAGRPLSIAFSNSACWVASSRTLA